MLKDMKLVNFTKIFDKGFMNCRYTIQQTICNDATIASSIKIKSYKSVYSLVSSFVKNEKLKEC